MANPTALILGGANTLEADFDAALKLFQPDLLIACNHAGRDHPDRIDHWATMHPELFPKWIEARGAAGLPPAGQLWHAKHRISTVDSQPLQCWGGSSGLLCVTLACDLGCAKIVLAGVPMRQNACHYDNRRIWTEARQYWPAWEASVAKMAGRVRSMSGWTAELLGRPTGDWLDD